LIITNFREYLDCLRNLFVNDNANSVDAYLQDMVQSGKKQRKYKEKQQKEIAVITAKINFLRQEMKQETDRRKISEQIKKLKENKTLLLKRLKQKTQTTRFAMLSDETKATLCTLKILRKYLTKELMENEFSGMKKDDNGDLIFDAKIFEDSFLYQDARHIYDYVSAYIVQNPEKVISESYFNKFFDKESGWRGIVNQANKFFDAQNKRKKTRAEIIAESKSDLEVVKEYPQNEVILVRLKTPEALDYEGSAAHNCVGGGSYDKLLSKGKSGIYSLRKLTKDGELKPVVTIEYNEGVVKQVRGTCNSIVAYDYNLPARDVVLRLMGNDNITDLVTNDSIKNDVLNSLGIYRDGKGGYLDIHNASGDEEFVIPRLVVEADSLVNYDFSKLKIANVEILGTIKNKDISLLKNFSSVSSLTIKKLEESTNLDFSDFDKLKNLYLTPTGDETIRLGGNKTLDMLCLNSDNQIKINLDIADSLKISSLHIYGKVCVDINNINFDKICIMGAELPDDFVFSPEINYRIDRSNMYENVAKKIINFKGDNLKAEGNRIIGEHCDFSDLKYVDLSSFSSIPNSVRFADEIEYLKVNCKFPDVIEGAHKVKSLNIGGTDVYKWLSYINLDTVEEFYCLNDDYRLFSHFSNLKALVCSLVPISSIPTSIERLKYNHYLNIFIEKPAQDINEIQLYHNEYNMFDMSNLVNLKDLTLKFSMSSYKQLRLPNSIEKLFLSGNIGKLEVLDLSNCHKLKDLHINLITEDIKEVRLPASVENIRAFNGGWGIGVLYGGPKHFKKDVKWNVPECAKPEVIAYLQKEWGKDSVCLLPVQSPKVQSLLPVMVMQKKKSRR